jgi:hypothetical protein
MSKKRKKKAAPVDGGSLVRTDIYRSLFHTFTISTAGSEPPTPTRSLTVRVADDIARLTAEFDGKGGKELPLPKPDLTAYTDALDAAIRSCPHADVEDTIHSRGEYQCVDCGKYLSRADMRARQAASPFRWFF